MDDDSRITHRGHAPRNLWRMKMNYKIRNRHDVEGLYINHDHDSMVGIVETGEALCVADLLYLYDDQDITVYDIGRSA